MEPDLCCKREVVTNTIFTKCILCQQVTNETTSILTNRGLDTFIKAIEYRKDEAYDRLWELIQDKEQFLSYNPTIHSSCRSSYTHKRAINQLMQSPNTPLTKCNETPAKKRRLDKHNNNKTCCFICEKQRDTKGKWDLVLIATEERQTTIHAKAKELQDEVMLTKIQGHGDSHVDMIAADFRYHRSCMNNYMNKKQTLSEVVDVYEEAFQELMSDISNPLLNNQSVFYITKLCSRYRDILEGMDVPNSSKYRASKLVKRLKKHFGDSIQIITPSGRRSVVCSSTITVGDMCILAAKLKKQLDDSIVYTDSDTNSDNGESDEESKLNNDIYAVAKHVRRSMKHKEHSLKQKSLDTPEVIDLSHEAASNVIPDSLYNLVAFIITKDESSELKSTGRIKVDRSVHEKVLNISQDIMSKVTNIPMPKNIGLALHVLRQTRSKDIVTALNRFGHSISYDEAQRYLTAMANDIETRTIENGIFIPCNLMQGEFVHCAFDNLDFHEDTKDGSTLHATSHNIYQYGGNLNGDSEGALPSKTRHRSLISLTDFQTPESNVSISTRRKARSLSNTSLNFLTEVDTSAENLLDDDTFIWSIMRQQYTALDCSDLVCVTWNDFFECQIDKPKDKTVIAYGPLYPQSPTDPNTVQASLDYLIALTNKLGQATTVVTCDQAIYDIAKGITHKYPDRYKNLLLRLGGFHIAENFLGAIGYFMKGSGIEQLLVQSGVCLQGTANKIMSGKDYYKMVRCHSLVCEAMLSLIWESFLQYIGEASINTLELEIHLEQLDESFKAKESAVSEKVNVVKSDLALLKPKWTEYCDQLSVTGKYWLMYITMVHILRKYVSAERSGSWDEHLTQVKYMLPYLVSAGHTKYASCVPLYLTDMYELPNKHPDVYEEFQKGKFTVHLVSGKFNGVWSDLALEQTYNKEGKTSLLKGISQTPNAREKYIKTVPLLTKVSESVKAMAHFDLATTRHHRQTLVTSKEDVMFVRNICETVENSMKNPFIPDSNEGELVNISTGQKCNSTDLVSVREKGIAAIKNAQESGADKIDIPKIETFAQKLTKKSTKSDITKIYQDETSVTRALCFFQNADEETRNVAFSHEWTEYPSSLFKPKESNISTYGMRKGNKSDFLSALVAQTDGLLVSDLPSSTEEVAFIVDFMAFVQRYKQMRAKQFGQLPSCYLEKIKQLSPHNCKLINIVGDRYDFTQLESLKADERENRSGGNQTKEYIPHDAAEIPPWTELMGCAKNKANLADYISESLCERAAIPEDLTVIVGGTFQEKTKCVAVRKDGVSQIQELLCGEHEEADTRIIAHMAYSANVLGFKRVVVYCTDTDVILLCMYHFCFLGLEELWIKKIDTFIPVHSLVYTLSHKFKKHPQELVSTLLTVYVLTGCDTTSYPFRKGKRMAARVALSIIGLLPNLAEFGRTVSVEVNDEMITEARLVFVKLYGKSDFDSLDLLRQHLFAVSNADLRSLPPTEDAFRHHVLRSLYQLLIYHRAFQSNLALPPPTDFGRKVFDGKLVPVLIEMPAKPKCVKTVACKCVRSRCLTNCQCAKYKVDCFIGCSCLGRRSKCGRAVPTSDSDSDTE